MLSVDSSVPAFILFGLVYGLIITRNVRGIRLPIWAIMSIGALLSLVLQLVTFEQALKAINFEIIFFLFGMFVLVSGLESSGLLKYITIKILERARTPNRILAFILLILGLLSAFLINDTIALVATPIVIGLATQMRIRPVPLLITLAFGVTIGSMMTPIGNPQNLLVSLNSGMDNPFLNFMLYLGVPTFACLAVTYLILSKFYKKEFDNSMIPPSLTSENIIENPTLARISLIITLSVIAGFFLIGFIKTIGVDTDINFSYPALVGGLLLLVITKQRKKIFLQINWKIIAFFVSMFVFMAAMWNGKVIDVFASVFPTLTSSDELAAIFAIISTSAGLSQIMSNVPFVAVYLQIMQNLGVSSTDTLLWIALASASTLAGNLTILGAASNIIILEAAEKHKTEAFSFWEFFKIGSIVTVVTMTILGMFLLLYSYV